MTCPKYNEPKVTKRDTAKLSPQLFSEWRSQCALIKSIDENLSPAFGKEYREKFCYSNFKGCQYKEATDEASNSYA
jgi:hypothetical protein